jgi:lysophospholipase L1-like esterase
MDGYRPRFVSLMIGTNNDDDPPEDRAEGIRAILAKMARRLPDATILLHPIFPRGAAPDDPCRVSRERTNAVIRRFADGGRVVWLDFNARFLQPDGTLSAAMMPDFLHPLEEGYRMWAEELRPFLRP